MIKLMANSVSVGEGQGNISFWMNPLQDQTRVRRLRNKNKHTATSPTNLLLLLLTCQIHSAI